MDRHSNRRTGRHNKNELWDINGKTALLQTSLNNLIVKQGALKSVKSCWNTKMSFYLETSGGQKFNLYLNIAYFNQYQY